LLAPAAVVSYTEPGFAIGQEQTVKSRSEEMKKTQRQLVKESFTKTRDERYAEMSKSEKLGYWIFGLVIVTIIFLMWDSA
jgi:hypothetical protein